MPAAFLWTAAKMSHFGAARLIVRGALLARKNRAILRPLAAPCSTKWSSAACPTKWTAARQRTRSFASTAAPDEASEKPDHRPTGGAERVKGPSDTMEFQAETRMLLDIVARSLYSDKEVFVRELISNASDALEKLRYIALSSGADKELHDQVDRSLEIHLATDKTSRILTIQDSGIGMTRDELISNIGTIAKSGSKAFLEQLKNNSPDSSSASSIIGQFGVGFYSAFMVAEKVEVFTRSSLKGAPGLKWSSDGSGTYQIQEADDVQLGSKIMIHLKTDCREFADEDVIQGIIKKYSNFVGSAIFLNGQRVNSIQPIWLMDPKEVTPEQHTEFYRFVGNCFDMPRFTLHYKTDAPLTIRAVLYFPEGKPGLFEMSRDSDVGVALYTRKVLIKSKAENILPKWLRFVKGVVDSEDIPLNLSRELLQNSSLIRKLRTVLTNRILRYLHDQSTKNPESFDQFYHDYGMFLKEGIVTNENQLEKEEIGKLLRFESSQLEPGKKISLPEYCSRIKEGQKDIYYLAAPSRALAESSPYYESLKKQQVEVLFCYEPYDELVLMQLRHFNTRDLTSVEKQMRQDTSSDASPIIGGENALSQTEIDELVPWIKKSLPGKVFSVKVTNKLDKHPCVVTVEEMAAARHFIRTQSHQFAEENRYTLLQPQLEINPKHPIIQKLQKLSKTDVELANLLTEQLFSNAMVAAGLVDDPRTLLTNMNQLLTRALEKH